MEERIQKFLSRAGVTSRRRAEKMILEGRVKVNGQIVIDQGVKIDPLRDQVMVDGRKVEPESEMEYILLYKPMHTLTTLYDPKGRPTVRDLFKGFHKRIFPVGRLDFNTTGILILTSDGELANHLLHPRYEVEKVYDVVVKGTVKNQQIRFLRRGVLMKGDPRPTFPAKVTLVQKRADYSRLRITIHEGRNRQIRRMCAAVGLKVIGLTRIGYAGLTLKGLTPGMYRKLTPCEVRQLKRAAGLISS